MASSQLPSESMRHQFSVNGSHPLLTDDFLVVREMSEVRQPHILECVARQIVVWLVQIRSQARVFFLDVTSRVWSGYKLVKCSGTFSRSF